MELCERSLTSDMNTKTDHGRSAMLNRLDAVSKLRERAKGDKGEIARVTRFLADAWRLKGNEAESMRLITAAETMRLEIQKHRTWQLPDEKRAYDILVWNEYW